MNIIPVFLRVQYLSLSPITFVYKGILYDSLIDTIFSRNYVDFYNFNFDYDLRS